MRVFDVITGDELLVFHHANQVFDVSFSNDGRWLASGSGHWCGPRPGEVRLWDAGTPVAIESNGIPCRRNTSSIAQAGTIILPNNMTSEKRTAAIQPRIDVGLSCQPNALIRPTHTATMPA